MKNINANALFEKSNDKKNKIISEVKLLCNIKEADLNGKYQQSD